MSLENKIMMLAGVLAITACSNDNDNDAKNDVNIDGVYIKTGRSDQDGKKSFIDSQNGNKINLHLITDNDSKNISDVDILFADGADFSLFTFSSGYNPIPVPVSTDPASNGLKPQSTNDNINYNFSLTRSPLQINKYEQGTPNQEAVKKAFEWSQNSWPITGCYNKEEIGNVMQPGGIMIKLGASYLTAGISEDFVGNPANYIEDKLEEDDIIVVHSFIPINYGIRATTSLISIDITKGNCDSYDQQIQDSQSKGQDQTSNNDPCSNTLFCDYFDDTLDKWNTKGSAYIADGWLVMEGASVITKENIDFQQCSSTQIEYQAQAEGRYGLFLGNEISLFGEGSEGSIQFACGAEEGTVNINLEENHLVKIVLGTSFTVNGTSIPCNKTANELNYSAGSISTLRLDYVKVRCN